MRRLLAFLARLLFPPTHEPRALLIANPDAPHDDVVLAPCDACATASSVCVTRRVHGRRQCCAACLHRVVVPAVLPPPLIRARTRCECETCDMPLTTCLSLKADGLAPDRKRPRCCAGCYHRPPSTSLPGPGEKMSR